MLALYIPITLPSGTTQSIVSMMENQFFPTHQECFLCPFIHKNCFKAIYIFELIELQIYLDVEALVS